VSREPGAAPQPRDVAHQLAEIATLLELNGADAFRSRAFRSASRTLEGTDLDLLSLARADRLTEVPGVGPAIAAIIREIVLSGRSSLRDELEAATPLGLFDLLRIPGLGTRRIRTLHEELGIDSLDALEAAAEAGRVAELSGFGRRTEERILDGVRFARASRGRRRYPEALDVAARLLDWLLARPEVEAAEIVGALRRRMEVVERVDLIAVSERPEATLGAFRALNGAAADGPEEAGSARVRLADGLDARLRCVDAGAFVAAVVWETGSDAHLAALQERATARGLELDDRGLRRGGRPVELADEEALYSALGLAYLPPELREGLGEVEAAASGSVPRLVETADLRGTFHCHTSWSDGRATVAEMAEGARALGWSYLGLADHSRAAAYAGGLTVERLRRQRREIDEWQRAEYEAAAREGRSPFRLYRGTECDILADGRLDYPPGVLRSLDYVVGSVHYSLTQGEEEMTERILRAVRSPELTILGHPTGRLLLSRAGYALDLRRVIDAAAEVGVAIEINANPHRLDLDWREARYAAGRGVVLAINPDAHSVPGLEHVAYGVSMARKAGLEPRQILNCWPPEEVEAFFAERKQGGTA
jgi:DNA polymerase (family 10)